jgi:hypothetical protein
MTIGKFIAGMFVLGLIVAYLVNIVIPGAEFSEYVEQTLAGILGSAFGIITLPALILLGWWKFRPNSKPPYFAAGGLFVFMAYFPISNTIFENSDFIHAPSGCEFAVTFPALPEIKPIQYPGIASASQASLARKRSNLMATCGVAKGTVVLTEQEFRQYIEQQLRIQGFRNIETKLKRHAQWIDVTGKATKVGEGREYTGSFRYLMGKKSILNVIATGISTEFPRPGMSKFLRSARLRMEGTIEPHATGSDARQAKTPNTGAFVYAPAGCDFAVTFPSRPKFEKRPGLDSGTTTKASVLANSSFMNAECIPTKGKSREEMEIRAKNILDEHMRNQGMGDVEIKVENQSRWVEATGRGTKTVNGVQGTYRFRLLFGPRSLLLLTIGGASKDYPWAIALDFIKSGRLKP